MFTSFDSSHAANERYALQALGQAETEQSPVSEPQTVFTIVSQYAKSCLPLCQASKTAKFELLKAKLIDSKVDLKKVACIASVFATFFVMITINNNIQNTYN